MALFRASKLLQYLPKITNFVATEPKFLRQYSDKPKMPAKVECAKAKGEPASTEEFQDSRKPGLFQKIKMKLVEGGTNFGTPFRRLECTDVAPQEVPPKRVLVPPAPPPGPVPEKPMVQMVVLNADTSVGQYIVEQLTKCEAITKLALYESTDSQCTIRSLERVVEDLKLDSGKCRVQIYASTKNQLEECLQNAKVVVILDNGFASAKTPFDRRFAQQAQEIKQYATAVARCCPGAFIIVCTTPVDCMVPLIAEACRLEGWYDSSKLMGSLAVAENKAAIFAAHALSLDPESVHVPCIGGTEGIALLPLFCQTVNHYDFDKETTRLMTDTLRAVPVEAHMAPDCYMAQVAFKAEALAQTKLIKDVVHALLTNCTAKVTGYVETNPSQMVTPCRYIASKVDISSCGITKNHGLPKLSPIETVFMDSSLKELNAKLKMVEEWSWKKFQRHIGTN